MNEKKENSVTLETIDSRINQSCLGSIPGDSLNKSCCPQGGKTQLSPPDFKQPFVTGSIQTPAGAVPQIQATLARTDRWGSIKARWGVGRMDYTLDPGLYALGTPDENSTVLVTANYKMSFDRLREALPARNAWILVLNTDGINVWCAAGKGTFGTEELVRWIEFSGLTRIVSHRRLVLPQLGGPGIAAHQVKKLSGFKVIYGPILAKDLPAFLDAELKATPEMRSKTFTTWERAVLIPIEVVSIIKWSLIVLPAFFLIGGLGGAAGFWPSAMNYGLFAGFALLGALFAGAVLTPLLLPWIPGRAFSLKGLIMGLIIVAGFIVLRAGALAHWQGRFEILAWLFLVPAISAYLAMNFTGASTYTSLSGVKKEMKWAVPLEIGFCAMGLCLWIGSRFIT
ncbi:MAG: acetyl-CoA synthase subunit gamma [Desulfobacterales bacterium]|nr:acetyl-CoA synthase subunit gamma [Desulfobacterales bacterium]